MMSTNDEEASVKVSKTKARGGVSHNVRYVLTFGLMGVIAAFIVGDKPNPAPDSVTTPPASQGAPPCNDFRWRRPKPTALNLSLSCA